MTHARLNPYTTERLLQLGCFWLSSVVHAYLKDKPLVLEASFCYYDIHVADYSHFWPRVITRPFWQTAKPDKPCLGKDFVFSWTWNCKHYFKLLLCLCTDTGVIFSVNFLSYDSVCTKQGTQFFSVVVQSLFWCCRLTGNANSFDSKIS